MWDWYEIEDRRVKCHLLFVPSVDPELDPVNINRPLSATRADIHWRAADGHLIQEKADARANPEAHAAIKVPAGYFRKECYPHAQVIEMLRKWLDWTYAWKEFVQRKRPGPPQGPRPSM